MSQLLPDFYSISKIEKPSEGNFEVEIKLHADAAVYQGHFPGMPIAPGACLTQMTKEVANTILEKELMLKEAHQIKFLATVNPNETPRLNLSLSLTQADEGYSLKCVAKDEARSYFKISGKLA